MAQRATGRPMTIADYLAFEATSEERHEYVEGLLYAQAGGSTRHNKLIGNLFGHLWNAARGGPCDIWHETLKLRVADDVIYYPDIMVTCDRTDSDALVVSRPCVVIEVLSPSSMRTDRREKLQAYRRMPSVQAYLIFYQDEQRVDRHWRDAAGAWQSDVLSGDTFVSVPCLDVDLALVDLYRDLPPVVADASHD